MTFERQIKTATIAPLRSWLFETCKPSDRYPHLSSVQPIFFDTHIFRDITRSMCYDWIFQLYIHMLPCHFTYVVECTQYRCSVLSDFLKCACTLRIPNLALSQRQICQGKSKPVNYVKYVTRYLTISLCVYSDVNVTPLNLLAIIYYSGTCSFIKPWINL